MGCPRLFSKNHDFYIFITWGYCIAIRHLYTSECDSYSSSQTMQCMTILSIPIQTKNQTPWTWLNSLILTYIDGFVSHWCPFGEWLIATDYQSGRCCPPFKSEKSHSPKGHHCRALTNRSWLFLFMKNKFCSYLFFFPQRRLMPNYIVKYDMEKGAPYRNKQGFCEVAKISEYRTYPPLKIGEKNKHWHFWEFPFHWLYDI